ncbi:MAG TPA: GNAT family N-acetyltransferase [Woeseiaceae bacterium]|nr:GNAT family N-acetyltransferase [Woeseiaceae bacterium]
MKAESRVRFRAAHRSEAAAIAGMSRLHVEHGLRWRWTPARVRKQIEDPETMVLVASLDGELAGFAIMRFGDLDAHLFLLAVAPRLRRTGIGRALLEWLEKSCRTAGIQNIRLEVRWGNRHARCFYLENGFRILGQVAGYYDRREAAVLMGKSLVR